jgi:hypothetical protein
MMRNREGPRSGLKAGAIRAHHLYRARQNAKRRHYGPSGGRCGTPQVPEKANSWQAAAPAWENVRRVRHHVLYAADYLMDIRHRRHI